MTTTTDRSIPELFGDAMAQLAKLVGNEFALARAELADKAAQAGRAAALIGAGAIIMMPALVLLLFAVATALIRSGFSDPVAYLCTGAGALLLSLPDFGKSSIAHLRQTLGLPSTDGVRPMGKKHEQAIRRITF